MGNSRSQIETEKDYNKFIKNDYNEFSCIEIIFDKTEIFVVIECLSHKFYEFCFYRNYIDEKVNEKVNENVNEKVNDSQSFSDFLQYILYRKIKILKIFNCDIFNIFYKHYPSIDSYKYPKNIEIFILIDCYVDPEKYKNIPFIKIDTDLLYISVYIFDNEIFEISYQYEDYEKNNKTFFIIALKKLLNICCNKEAVNNAITIFE